VNDGLVRVIIYKEMNTSRKVVVIGPQGAGKTSLITRLRCNTFVDRCPPTIGACFQCLIATNEYSEPLNIGVWDCSGQERFNAFLPQYIRGADVVLICLNTNSIEELDRYLRYCREYGSQSRVIVVVTQSDLKKPCESFITYVTSQKIPLFTTSSLTGEGIDELWKVITEYVQQRSKSATSVPISSEPSSKALSRKCCSEG
jgi:small GTP-binding protein